MPSDDGTRRRLLLISAAATSLTLGNLAWEVLGPLWCTAELGLDPDGWARLRSLRFTGTLVGTVLIGLAAGWWGARRVGIAALLLAGAALGAIAMCGRPALVLALPVFGAAISAVFIALNTLTQQVDREQQARANSIYRSVGREAQTFTVWKVFQGGSAVLGMQLCALLEPRLGMGGVLAWGAMLAIAPWTALRWWSGRDGSAA